MLSDPFRGQWWLKAICLCNAKEVHICTAPEALELIRTILFKLRATYTVVNHERLVPLKYSGSFKDIADAAPGDALICFSRKRVLQIAAVLEKANIPASVIYGSLPPASRRREVERFSNKETSVVVATDAIGMGISLPIKRIIFVETEKFDGTEIRSLKKTEIRQIAGRAGRFGKYDLGEVLSMSEGRRIKRALEAESGEIVKKLVLGFPKEALNYDYPFGKLLKMWNEIPPDVLFDRADMSDAEYLLTQLGSKVEKAERSFIYELITCPVDVKNEDLVFYWKQCCLKILDGEIVPKPCFTTRTLEGCELQYKAYDVYHQLLRKIGIEDDCLAQKEKLTEKINELLKKEKSNFLKKCRMCGAVLPISGRFNLCDECYEKQRSYWWDDEDLF